MKKKILLIGWADSAKDDSLGKCFDTIKDKYEVFYRTTSSDIIALVGSLWLEEEPIFGLIFNSDFIASEKVIVKHLYKHALASRATCAVNIIRTDDDKDVKLFAAGEHIVSFEDCEKKWDKVWQSVLEIIEYNIALKQNQLNTISLDNIDNTNYK